MNQTPHDCVARELLGDIYSKRESFSDSLNEYSKALKFGGTPSTLLSKISSCYYLLGKRKKAKKIALKALKKNPNNSYAQNVLIKLGSEN